MYNICPNSMGVGPPLVPGLWGKILVVKSSESRKGAWAPRAVICRPVRQPERRLERYLILIIIFDKECFDTPHLLFVILKPS
jgi:hypothetical protein